MILGATITIPDPTSLSMPDFQPMWAWILGGISGWYVFAALVLRWLGFHKHCVADFTKRVQNIKDRYNLQNPDIVNGSSHEERGQSAVEQIAGLKSPGTETLEMLMFSPVLIPLTLLIKVLEPMIKYPAIAMFWLAGGYQRPPLDDKKEAQVPTSKNSGQSAEPKPEPTNDPKVWHRWVDRLPRIGSTIMWRSDTSPKYGAHFMVTDGDGNRSGDISWDWIKRNHIGHNAEWQYVDSNMEKTC